MVDFLTRALPIGVMCLGLTLTLMGFFLGAITEAPLERGAFEAWVESKRSGGRRERKENGERRTRNIAAAHEPRQRAVSWNLPRPAR